MLEGIIKSYVKDLGGKIEPSVSGPDVRFSDFVVVGDVESGMSVHYELYVKEKNGPWAKRVKQA